MKPILLLVCLSCYLPARSWTQEVIARYDPGLTNSFLGAYRLNDTTYRVFSNAVGGSITGYSSFIVTDFIHGEPFLRQYNIDSFDYPPLYDTYELFVLSLPSGDAMLAGNFFDCDIGGFAVMKMTADYHAAWDLYSYEIGSGAYQITQAGLVAPDVAVLVTDADERLYISFAGDVVTYPDPPHAYLYPHYSGQYIFGYRDAHWFKLNYQMQVIDSLAIDTVAFIAPIGSNFLIQTNDTILLVDSFMQVVAGRELLSGINSAVELGNKVGIGNNFLFMVLDAELNTIQSYLTMPYERINYAMGNADTAYILSTYNGIRHSDILSRRYVPGQVLTSGSPDLRLQFIDIPDTVFVNYDNGNWINDWQFGASTFGVENPGDDTIQHFRLECNWFPFAVMCSNYERTWTYEDVNLLPGESRVFDLEPFIAALIIGHHSPFCFWIESANGLPDPNPNDNYACDAAQIVTSSIELEVHRVNIYPNPAGQEFTIHQAGGTATQLHGALFDISGKPIRQFDITDEFNTIPLTNIQPGVYLVRMLDDKGRSQTSKLIIR